MKRKNVALVSSAAVALASAGVAWVLGKKKKAQTPSEINPLPEDRAFDREKNIEFLRQNYPERDYQQQPAQTEPQPSENQQQIEKDKPLSGFHGG